MGRPSKLTEKQWGEIDRRRLKGEGDRALAREFGISEAAIRLRFSAQHKTVKAVANQLVDAEMNLRSLPIAVQVSALNYADELRAISTHLAGAAKFGAATAHRLAGIAHMAVQKIDDAQPLDDESRKTISDVAALTRTSNEAASTGLTLLTTNKGEMARAEQERNKASSMDDGARNARIAQIIAKAEAARREAENA